MNATYKEHVERLRAKRYALLQRTLKRILSSLSSDPSVEKVILFGSLAKGTVGVSSDIDLVVVKNTTERFFDRIGSLLEKLDPEAPCDILVYTPDEWKFMSEHRLFGQLLAKRGKVIYEKSSGRGGATVVSRGKSRS